MTAAGGVITINQEGIYLITYQCSAGWSYDLGAIKPSVDIAGAI